jgi:hypothetical protein
VRGDPDGDPLVDPVARLEARRAQQQRCGHQQAERGEQRRMYRDAVAHEASLPPQVAAHALR